MAYHPTDDNRSEIEELCISAKSKLLSMLGQHRRRESTYEITIGAVTPPAN